MKWNKENTAKLLTLYKGDNSELEQIAQSLQTSSASVRSKLVVEGVYIPTIKTGFATSKPELINAIEILLSCKAGSLASLQNASASSLQTLTNALIQISERVNLLKGK